VRERARIGQTLMPRENALWHADRGTLLLATSFGFLLFLMVVACVPGVVAKFAPPQPPLRSDGRE
jgi:hypothetical protein